MHLKADKRKLTIRRPYYNPLAILFGIPTVAISLIIFSVYSLSVHVNKISYFIGYIKYFIRFRSVSIDIFWSSECSRSNWTTPLWPFLQANINGVLPQMSLVLSSIILAWWFRSSLTTSLRPCMQAIMNAVHPWVSLAFRLKFSSISEPEKLRSYWTTSFRPLSQANMNAVMS